MPEFFPDTGTDPKHVECGDSGGWSPSQVMPNGDYIAAKSAGSAPCWANIGTDAGIPSGGDATLGFVIQRLAADWTTAADDTLLEGSDLDRGNLLWRLYRSAATVLSFQFANGSGGLVAPTWSLTVTNTTSKWYVALLLEKESDDLRRVTPYVNGVAGSVVSSNDASGTPWHVATADSGMHFGIQGSASQCALGKVHWLNRLLTGTEIGQINTAIVTP